MQSQCVIGSETGPLHLAALIQKKIVSISPTKYTMSFRWGPFNTDHVVIKKPQECPLTCHTYRRVCTQDYCVDSIQVSDVMQATEFILNHNHFPKHHLYYWFKTNATIAIHIEDCDPITLECLDTISTLLQEGDIQWFICTSSKSVYMHLSSLYPNIMYAIRFNLVAWIKAFSHSNVTVWHSLGYLPAIWRVLLQKMIAFNIDKEPVYIRTQKRFESLSKLLDMYISTARRLSKAYK
tara:strand:- start:92 stop:802 length:711 start_codon:yes stop_codon:yes gene_type:complete